MINCYSIYLYSLGQEEILFYKKNIFLILSVTVFYYLKVSGIPSGKLIKTIRYPYMRRYDILTCKDIDDFADNKFVS